MVSTATLQQDKIFKVESILN